MASPMLAQRFRITGDEKPDTRVAAIRILQRLIQGRPFFGTWIPLSKLVARPFEYTVVV